MKAVILAGGLGERLRPFTQAIPKPLLPIEYHRASFRNGALISIGTALVVVASTIRALRQRRIQMEIALNYESQASG